MITIADHGAGNVKSLIDAFDKIGVNVEIGFDQNQILNSDKIIIPGVGHFKSALNTLKMKGIDVALKKVADKGVPILGICLGMQLLYEFSDEGLEKGLSLIKGKVKKIDINDKIKYKLPNVGWRKISKINNGKLLNGINEKDNLFYFCNTYGIPYDDNLINLNTKSYFSYEEKYISIIEHKNIFGVQFHPEKSHNVGLKLLKNFIEI